MGKNKGSIVKFNGGNLYYKQVNMYGGQSSDTWTNLGYIQSAAIKDITDQEDQADMTGNTVRSLPVKRSVKIELVLMQSDKDTLDFIKEGCRGNYYAIMLDGGVVDGKHQEYYFPLCVIRPQVELASGVRRPPLEINVLSNPEEVRFAYYETFLPTESYSVDDVFYTSDRVYLVTTAGVSGGTAPTHRSGSATNGTMVCYYVGEYNRPTIAYGQPSLGSYLLKVESEKYYEVYEHTS